MAQLIIFTNNFPFGNGETFLETEIRYLANHFKDIHIFPLYYGQSNLARQVPDNITYSKPFFNIDVPTNQLSLLIKGSMNSGPLLFAVKEFFSAKVYLNFKHFKNWLSEVCIIRYLLTSTNKRIFYSELQADTILYFYWGDKSSGIIPFLKKELHNPIVVRFHNSDLYEEIKHGYLPFRPQLLRSITSGIFISEKGQEYMKNRYPFIRFNSYIYKLGVREIKPSSVSSDGIFRIVSCSYVVPIKRIHLIIDALNTLDFNIEWTHIGGGPLLDQIEKKSMALKPNIKAVFLGHVNNDAVMDYYKTHSIDLFINVSQSEGIPVSIMEAISAGIPVIATDVGGVSEIIDTSFGTLIDKDFPIQRLGMFIQEYYSKNIEEKLNMRKAAIDFWNENYNAEKNYALFAQYLIEL